MKHLEKNISNLFKKTFETLEAVFKERPDIGKEYAERSLNIRKMLEGKIDVKNSIKHWEVK